MSIMKIKFVKNQNYQTSIYYNNYSSEGIQ